MGFLLAGVGIYGYHRYQLAHGGIRYASAPANPLIKYVAPGLVIMGVYTIATGK